MSTPLCSFVVYLNQDSELAPRFLQDVRHFFTKFPIPYEVVFIVDQKGMNHTSSLESLSSSDSPREKISILHNAQKLRRAESLRRGLSHAQGEYLLIADVSMQTPLGDLFKILQQLMTDESLEICWGERYSKKSGSLSSPKTSRHELEHLFNRILQEKMDLKTSDILCEAFGLRKKSWQQLDSRCSPQSGWYLGPALRHSCKIQRIASKDVFINDSGSSPRSYSIWRERWNLFKFSLKNL